MNSVKAQRDARKVADDAADALRKAAADANANTMPLILDAVKAYCTVGEISDALRDVFGTYEEPALF